jgi:hypothetical protein
MPRKKIAVSYSGGKDSIYLLLLAKHLGHDVLAISVDTGFLSGTGWRNILRVPEQLHIDHIILRGKKRFTEIYREKIPRIGNYPFDICAACHSQIDAMVIECSQLYKCDETWSGMSPDEESLFPKGILKDQCCDCEFKAPGCCGRMRCAAAAKFLTQMQTCPLKKWDAPVVLEHKCTIDDFCALTGMRTPLCEPGFAYDAEEIIAVIRDAGLSVETSPLRTNCRVNAVIVNDNMRKRGVNPYTDLFESQPKVARRLKWITTIARATGVLQRMRNRVVEEVYATDE